MPDYYQGIHTGQEVDEGVAFGLNPDASPQSGSTKGVTSGGVYSAVKAAKLAALVTKSVTGNPAIIPDGADGVPFRSLTVDIVPVQTGSGDPSPSNIRPITQISSVKITQTDGGSGTADYTIQFGRSIFGGTLNLITGVMSINRVGMAFDGTEDWEVLSAAYTNIRFRLRVGGVQTYGDADLVPRGCSHFRNGKITSTTYYPDEIGFGPYTSSGSPTQTWLMFRPTDPTVDTEAKWEAFLAAQAAADTPVTCWWEITGGITTVQLTPPQINTLLGQNVLSSDNAGDLDVSYYCDPTMIYEEIIAALGGD